LLSGHADGISQLNPSNGTFSANTNLFWNTSDLIVGDNPIQQDPLLTPNYHLSSSSPAINAGIDGGVTIDVDGDPRDDGNPDIGADEFSPVNPNKGTIGTEILLYGSDFGAKKGKVLIGGSAPKVLEWEDNSIHCQLTKALSPVTYGVTIQPKGLDQIFIEDGFTVKAPKIDSFDPSTGSTGEEITIHGSFFGTKKGKVTLGEKSCKVRSWTMDPVTGESEIRFVVPKGLDSGTNELKVINKVGEDTENFSVD
jgi:hypothetical protein